MKLLLLRAARIRHEAGETVEVSPAEAGFLLSTNSAVPALEMPNKRETPENKLKAETRKAEAQPEGTSEAKNKPKSTTRTKK